MKREKMMMTMKRAPVLALIPFDAVGCCLMAELVLVDDEIGDVGDVADVEELRQARLCDEREEPRRELPYQQQVECQSRFMSQSRQRSQEVKTDLHDEKLPSD